MWIVCDMCTHFLDFSIEAGMDDNRTTKGKHKKVEKTFTNSQNNFTNYRNPVQNHKSVRGTCSSPAQSSHHHQHHRPHCCRLFRARKNSQPNSGSLLGPHPLCAFELPSLLRCRTRASCSSVCVGGWRGVGGDGGGSRWADDKNEF